MAGLSDILETTQLEKVAGGFVFTEGPLWHPDGFYYFVDIRQNLLYRMVLGQKAEVVRKTIGGNGTTFDLQGRLINCEGDGRMVTRLERGRHGDDAGGSVRGQEAEPTERRDLPFERFAVFHRPCLSRAGGGARAGRGGVPHRAGRGGQPGGAGRVSERSGAVAGRTDAVHREHALAPVHPRGGAGCGGQHGAAAGVRRHVGGRHERRAGRHEGRCGRAGCSAPAPAACGCSRRTARRSASSRCRRCAPTSRSAAPICARCC